MVYKLKNEKKRTNIPTFKSSPGKLGPGPAVGLPVVVGRANLFEQTALGSFSLPLILRTQALVASWIAHQTAACPNTWFTGTVLVGNEMNSSEILLLNSFSGVSLLSPDWYCSVLAGYLLSSGHVPGTGFGNSFLVFSNLVGRLFRRLVLTDSTGTSLLRQSSSHIFGHLLVQVHFQSLYDYLQQVY